MEALTFILIFTLVFSVSSIIWQFSPQQRAIREKVAQANKDIPFNAYSVFALLTGLGGLPLPAFWVWWAFSTDDWRYAVIGVVPLISSVLSHWLKAIAKRRRREALIDAIFDSRGIHI